MSRAIVWSLYDQAPTPVYRRMVVLIRRVITWVLLSFTIGCISTVLFSVFYVDWAQKVIAKIIGG